MVEAKEAQESMEEVDLDKEKPEQRVYIDTKLDTEMR